MEIINNALPNIAVPVKPKVNKNIEKGKEEKN